MNKVFSYLSSNELQTASFGKALSKVAQIGDVFALYGTLGMGKSVLARAFIQAVSNQEEVPSPTFTLLQTYEGQDFDVYHFDLYRIKQAEEIFEIGIEDAIYGGVSLIEWPEKMGGYLPLDIIKIEITPQGDGRLIEIFTNSETKAERFKNLNIN